MTNPFDNLWIREAAAAAGIARRPGLARQMLDELAPLLRSDGIDLDDLGPNVDLAQLSAALRRATDRHNLELLTPVGTAREQVTALLADLSVTLARGEVAEVWALLDTIGPEPTADRPAISHVIGAAVGLLDRWHADQELAAPLATVRLPRWTRELGRIGTDLLALARRGRAFDSLDALHRRHQGVALYRAAALLTGTSINAVAAHRDAEVAVVAADLLASLEEPDQGAATSGRETVDRDQQSAISPIVSPAPAQSLHQDRFPEKPKRGRNARKQVRQSPWQAPVADRATLREFGRYLRQVGVFAAPTVDLELELMGTLLLAARQAHLQLQDPADLGTFAEMFLAAADDEGEDEEDPTGAVLATLDDYVHFKLATDDDPGWEDAHDRVEDALSEWENDGPDPIMLAVDAANRIDPALRRKAFAQTRAVSAVGLLLQWLGSGRQAAPSGGLRRVDIEHVAGLLGISAVGVNKRPPIEPPDLGDEGLFDLNRPDRGPGTIYAMSMFEVPLLAAWWEALRVAEVIQTAPSRIRPGAKAAEWLAESEPSLELAHTVIGFTVAQSLIGEFERGWFGEDIVAAISVSRLLQALAAEVESIEIDHPFADMFRSRSTNNLQALEGLGILTMDDHEAVHIPAALQGAVAQGVGTAVAVLQGIADAAD